MKKHIQKIREEIFTVGRSLALVSAIILVLSAFMTWGYTDYVTITGIAGDGLITRVVGILAFLFLFVKAINIWVSLVLGLIGLAIGVNDFISISQAVKEFSGSIGNGMYLTVIAGIGIVLGTIIEIIEEKKNKLNLFYIDKQ